MTMGIKLNTLGMAFSLVFSHYFSPLFIVGAILCAIGLIMIFLDR